MKRRVLQLIDSLQISGGSERQAAQLSQLLHQGSRYEVYVACMNPNGGMGEELKKIGIDDIPSFPLNSFYNHTTITELRRFARYLKEKGIDIVQTHDFYTNVFGMVGARLAGVPVRIAARRETTGCRSEAQKFVERRAYQLAHAVIANAAAVRDQLILEGVRKEKIVISYNGLNLDRTRPKFSRAEALEFFHLPADRSYRYVTILANLLSPVKDHPTFLRAAQRVRQAVPDARFILAGEGPLIEPMQSLAADLGLQNEVYFTGPCKEVGDLLSISDICVLSSIAEGFSNSILEYMGASRPVVATAVGGAPEAIVEAESGYLVKPGDWETMGARIIELLRNPDRSRQMGLHGRRLVEEKFSTRAQVSQIEGLYDRLLEREVSKLSVSVDTAVLCISLLGDLMII